MGLFLDADGIPLAFPIQPGNTNEQTTLKTPEQRVFATFSRLVLLSALMLVWPRLLTEDLTVSRSRFHYRSVSK